MAKQFEQVTRGINRQAVSVPPRGSAPEMKQVEMWKKYILWEKSNPLDTEEYGQFAKRGILHRVFQVIEFFHYVVIKYSSLKYYLFTVVYAYEQALLCLGYYPDMWYEAALFLQQASKTLEEKGDVKLSQQMTVEAMQLFDRAIGGLMNESQLLFFAYADFEEERMKFDNVKKIYDKLIAIEHIDPTLTYVQLMKFTRRTEGVRAARGVFKRAREDPRSRHHVFVAAALMEYYCSKVFCSSKIIFIYFYFKKMFCILYVSVKLSFIPYIYITLISETSTYRWHSIWLVRNFKCYPRPDTDQMIPFKPKTNTFGSFHPVPGGVFPPPPAAAHLLTLLPPPWSFQGPFVSVDLLMDSLLKYQPTNSAPIVDTKVKLENGTMLGPMRVEDAKKDFYQLLATTTDPNVAMSSSEFCSTTTTKKRRMNGDSDSEDETRTGPAPRDIYKRRMNQKAGE
uniref:Suf domain-containing protein n=1 Tax=Heterorhabditis bacteriophora TaxID=37862 RepID=A0A1I7XTD6_HETBA